MFLLSSDSAKTTSAAGFESLPSPSFFSMANAYDMTGPVEILQLRHSPDKENNFFTLFENNIAGVYYASFSPLEEISDLIPIDHTSLQSMTCLHSHEYYEFMFLIDGEIYQNIEHFRHYYPAGGCCLVDPHVLHAEEYATACRVLFFKISQSFMQQILAFPRYFPSENNTAYHRLLDYIQSERHFTDFIPANGYEWIQHHIHNIFERMICELSAPSDNISLKLACYASQLMMELFDPVKFSNTPLTSEHQRNQDLFNRIRKYMLTSDRKITRADLEAHFNYSGDTLYKTIKNFARLSIHDYSSYICMKKAADLLISSDENINDIAESVGFRNFTQFYREFKKFYHVTPREYRLAYASYRQKDS